MEDTDRQIAELEKETAEMRRKLQEVSGTYPGQNTEAADLIASIRGMKPAGAPAPLGRDGYLAPDPYGPAAATPQMQAKADAAYGMGAMTPQDLAMIQGLPPAAPPQAPQMQAKANAAYGMGAVTPQDLAMMRGQAPPPPPAPRPNMLAMSKLAPNPYGVGPTQAPAQRAYGMGAMTSADMNMLRPLQPRAMAHPYPWRQGPPRF